MCQPRCERILDLLGCLKIVVLLLLSLDHFVYICHCRFWLNMIMKIGRLESGSKYMMEAGSYFWWNRQWCGVKDQIHQIQEDHSCGQLWWECKAMCEFCLKCLVKSLYSYMKFLVLVLIQCTQNLTCRPGRFFITDQVVCIQALARATFLCSCARRKLSRYSCLFRNVNRNLQTARETWKSGIRHWTCWWAIWPDRFKFTELCLLIRFVS